MVKIDVNVKVICISDSDYANITVGKLYEGKIYLDSPGLTFSNDIKNRIFITNDMGFEYGYDISHFKSLCDIRNEKLNKLGI